MANKTDQGHHSGESIDDHLSELDPHQEAPKQRSRSYLRVAVVAILLFGVLAGAALRLGTVAHKQTPSHNEAISFIAATCHQGQWSKIEQQDRFPNAHWAHVSDWQRLWQVDKKFCFSEISQGLLEGDIHPPLYFWILHLWSLVFGIGIQSATLLNVLIAAATGLALFGLARRVIGNSLVAALGVFIWFVSPAVVSIAGEARQYDLFTLVTVAFFWQIFRLSDPRRRIRLGDWLLLAIIALAGVLTQFIFGVVAAIGCCVLALGLLRRRTLPGKEIVKRIGVAITAIATGYIALPFLHPGFQSALQTGKIRGGRFSVEEFSERCNRVLATITDFFIGKGVNNGLARFVIPPLIIVACCTWLTIWYKRRKGQQNQPLAAHRSSEKLLPLPGDGNDEQSPIHIQTPLSQTPLSGGPKEQDPVRLPTLASGLTVFLAFALTAVTIILYISFYTPNNAMGASYLSWAWPFISLTIAIATTILRPQLRIPVLATIAVLFLFSSIASTWRVDRAAGSQPNAKQLIQSESTLFVDTVRRGILPPILWHAGPNQRIYAAKQQEILNYPERWENRLGDRFLYVGGTLMGSTKLDRREVIRVLDKENRPERTLGAIHLWYPKLLTGTPETVMLWKRA